MIRKTAYIFVIIINFLVISQSQALTYPQAIWSSDRIGQSIIGVLPIDLGENKPYILLLTAQSLSLNKVDGKLIQVARSNKASKGEWIKASLFDLDNDGTQEVIVSGFRRSLVVSEVFKVNPSGIMPFGETSLFVNVIKVKGRDLLVGQKSLGQDDYSGPIYRLNWNGKKLIKGAPLSLNKGLSPESVSLYRIEGAPIEDDAYLVSSKIGNISIYKNAGGKYKRQWTSGQAYGGSVNFVKREIKDALNHTKTTRFFVPIKFLTHEHLVQKSFTLREVAPVVAVDDSKDKKGKDVPTVEPTYTSQTRLQLKPSFYAVRNHGYLKNVIGAVPSVKNAQLVKLVWSGYGFQEVWNSPNLDGAISDFALIDWDGDDKEDLILSLLLRDKGYVDTLKKQDSVIMVIETSSSSQ